MTEPPTTDPLLEVDDLTMQFMGVRALDAVSFAVSPGTIHALIGPNGAGKTTTMNCISGAYVPTDGQVWLAGAPLPTGSPAEVAAAGVARTFQHAALFDGMTVEENVLCGTYRRGHAGFLRGAIHLGSTARQEGADRALVRQVLTDLALDDVADVGVDILPLGTRKRVDLARAVVQQPRLVLLDEPLAGLAEDERTLMRQQVHRLVEDGITVVMIEHDMPAVMAMADRITVLDFGRRIAEGAPAEVRTDPAVLAAYLGTDGATDLGAG